MRLPRNIGGKELAKLLNKYGYQITRQICSKGLADGEGGYFCNNLECVDKWYEICYTLVGKGGESYAQDNQGSY
jgi:hypothetical protein